MNYRILFSILTLFVFGITACYSAMSPYQVSSDRKAGAGDLSSPERELAAFDAVNISGNFNTVIEPSDQSRITINADQSEVERVIAVVEDGTLYVEQEATGWFFNRTSEIELRIETPRDLKGISLSGSNYAHVIRNPNLRSLNLSGSSEVLLDEIDTAFMEISASGASKIEGNGFADELAIRLSGSSRLDFEHLRSEIAGIRSSGGSRIVLHVNQELEVTSSGASSVYYAGSPEQVNTSSSGTSRVQPLEQMSGR